MPTLTPTSTAQKIAEPQVRRRLDADRSNGYAVARYVLAPGQKAWNPHLDQHAGVFDFTGPMVLVYVEQDGTVRASAS